MIDLSRLRSELAKIPSITSEEAQSMIDEMMQTSAGWSSRVTTATGVITWSEDDRTKIRIVAAALERLRFDTSSLTEDDVDAWIVAQQTKALSDALHGIADRPIAQLHLSTEGPTP